MTRLTLIAVLLAGAAGTGWARELPAGTAWSHAEKGAVPAGAVAIDLGPPGPAEHVCRARVGQALHLGRLLAGQGGCSIGIGGREWKLPAYEVLVQPMASRLATTTAATTKATALATHATAALSDTPRRGVTPDGRPFLEERRPDGSVLRQFPNELEIVSPDGQVKRMPVQTLRHSVQAGSPPPLPADPGKGLGWMQAHNDALLQVIATLVHNDAAALKALSTAETRDVGADVFAQIRYRTDIAAFFASKGSR